ncbi:MAG: shikimate dehydrogenase [Rhodobacterales bacterium CG2_30_65_12]|nr:MAG: shikimate dehydrogenase [Rhodobacterales bacterium CG2_30_65_12]
MITGRTRILAHLGVPTESFTAPMIYNPYFEAKGIDIVTVPMGCEREDFPAFLALLFKLRNIAGALITMPHKIAAAALVDVASPAVQIAGACNAVKRDGAGRLIGDLFDGEGFLRGMRAKGQEAAGRSALIVGAGGVGSAIAAALAGAGVRRIVLAEVNQAAANRLAANLGRAYPGLAVEIGAPDPAGHDIVANATPLGMRADDPLPLDPTHLAPEAFVGEVVLSARETPLLAAARAQGCRTQPGTDMLFEQIPAYLEFFDLPTASAGALRALAQIRT